MNAKKDQIDVILPVLVKTSRECYVQYSVYNPVLDEMVRYRIRKGFSQCKTSSEVNKLSSKIIVDLTKKLRGGWRPWKSDAYIYRDQTLYSTDFKILGSKTKHDGCQIKRYVGMFIEHKSLSVSRKSMESYISKLRIFVKWLEREELINLKIYQLDETIINSFITFTIAERDLDRLSVEKYQQNLSQFFKYCKGEKIIIDIPTGSIPKPPKMKDMAARPISDEDLVKLFSHIAKNNHQLYVACMFQFFLCCRPGSELRLLKIEDVNISSRIVHIRQETGKTGARKITMPEALVEFCNQTKILDHPAHYYLFGSEGAPGDTSVSVNYFSYYFRKYRTELSLSVNYKFYSLKHTAAGKLLESGATIVEVKNHLGHKDFESTIHYIKRHFGEKSEKVSNFKPDFLRGFI